MISIVSVIQHGRRANKRDKNKPSISSVLTHDPARAEDPAVVAALSGTLTLAGLRAGGLDPNYNSVCGAREKKKRGEVFPLNDPSAAHRFSLLPII